MVINNLTEDEWLENGLQFVGFDAICQRNNGSANLRRFKSNYGINPRTCIQVFNDLHTLENGVENGQTWNAKYFLMALNWLKTYRTEPLLAGTFHINERTIRLYLWRFAQAIQRLKSRKVCLLLRHIDFRIK